MYSQGDKQRIGKISIEHNFQGKYTRLRFTYPKGKRQSITIGETTQRNRDRAVTVAYQIDSDIKAGVFDYTLNRYDPTRQSVSLEIVKEHREPTILELWERYKDAQKNIAAATTQKTKWGEIDRLLLTLPNKWLLLKNIDTLGDECLKRYAASTLHRYFQSLQPAIRQQKGYESINLKKQLPKLEKKRIEWFEPNEIKAILQSMENDRYSPQKNAFSHSHYYPYCAFCAFTGCRPEEAIALTWNGFRWSDNNTKCQVIINKVFSCGILKHETKNRQIRIIPLSEGLIKIIKEWKNNVPYSKDNLAFPNLSGGYLDINNYRKRIWSVVVKGLVNDGIVKRYLPPYNLRHSFVTNLHYNHQVSFGIIAGIIGDEVQTVVEKYTGLMPFDAGQMPDIY